MSNDFLNQESEGLKRKFIVVLVAGVFLAVIIAATFYYFTNDFNTAVVYGIATGICAFISSYLAFWRPYETIQTQIFLQDLERRINDSSAQPEKKSDLETNVDAFKPSNVWIEIPRDAIMYAGEYGKKLLVNLGAIYKYIQLEESEKKEKNKKIEKEELEVHEFHKIECPFCGLKGVPIKTVTGDIHCAYCYAKLNVSGNGQLSPKQLNIIVKQLKILRKKKKRENST